MTRRSSTLTSLRNAAAALARNPSRSRRSTSSGLSVPAAPSWRRGGAIPAGASYAGGAPRGLAAGGRGRRTDPLPSPLPTPALSAARGAVPVRSACAHLPFPPAGLRHGARAPRPLRRRVRAAAPGMGRQPQTVARRGACAPAPPPLSSPPPPPLPGAVPLHGPRAVVFSLQPGGGGGRCRGS